MPAEARQVIREINGVPVLDQRNNTVFMTDASSGVTQTRTLTPPLPGSNKVEVKDVAQIDGEVTFVGASLTDKAFPTKTLNLQFGMPMESRRHWSVGRYGQS